ncbi:MAG: cytochrome c3 family protein [Deltaproteobacteria bacterium]|nr:MAG: cytochrome c3 family protein [Deltaproteobacteria bacterium]
MDKRILFLIAVVLFSGIAVISGYPQEEMEFLDNSVFDKPVRTPSVFRHEEHNETAAIEECNECHHIYENGKKMDDESSEDQRCSDCHDKKDSGNKLALRKAFHKNCKGCHIQQNKGPVMCGECHRR